jgi:hypothetical protein
MGARAATTILVAALVVASARLAAAQSPFGPGYDPLQPPPEEPKDSGPGIVGATLVASGAAEVEELQDPKDENASRFLGVALDVRIAAGSTTPVLGRTSVTALTSAGEALPLVVACTPTGGDALTVAQGGGASIGAWHVAIGDKNWFCGGRNARLAVRVGSGGLRLVVTNGSEWTGPLLLLFERRDAALASVVIPGAKVNIPAPPKTNEAVPASPSLGGKG